MVKLIPLTQNKNAIVDDADYEWLMKYKWCVAIGYAVSGRSPRLMMHRLVNNTPAGMETDHINGDPLDNRRANLRSVTVSQNQMNRRNLSTNTSGIRGVYWHKREQKWEARIKVNQRNIYLGSSKSKSEMAKLRKDAELEHFGVFASGGKYE